MKRNIFYLLIIIGTFFTACTGKNNAPTPPVITGSFAGKFKLYHINPNTSVVRVDSANLNLSMETATGFKVTGDTTTLHAGSYGTYQIASFPSEISFLDKTYPASGNAKKIHLSGVYTYAYDGTTLQLLGYGPMDTLQFFYKLTKTGN